jgi:hypothetical protein
MTFADYYDARNIINQHHVKSAKNRGVRFPANMLGYVGFSFLISPWQV